MNKNYLNAVIVNTFLESLNNPALPVKGVHEVFVDIETNKFTNPTVEESIKELGFIWSEAYVEDILNRNRRIIPFTAQDILDADNAGIDILVFKSCINDSIQKAEVAIENVKGLRIEKAKKGSPEYEEWLRKYREKRSGKKPEETEKKPKKENQETIKARKALAGITSATAADVSQAVNLAADKGATPSRIGGVNVTIHSDDESTMFQVHSDYSQASATAATFMVPKSKLTKKDMGDVAVAINKIINGQPDYYLPKPASKEVD